MNEIYALEILRTDLQIGLDQSDEEIREVFEKIILWLTSVYIRVDWSKIAKSKNVYPASVFQRRVNSAVSQCNIRRMNQKLCQSLDIQTPDIASEILDFLELNRITVFRLLRREDIYFVMKSMELSKKLYERRERGDLDELQD